MIEPGAARDEEGRAPGLSPFAPAPRWQRWLEGSAGALSIGFHVLILALLISAPTVARKAEEWVQVSIAEPPPPPPPTEAPKPPPEPPKAKPTPRSVAFEKLADTPEPAPPVETPKAAAPRTYQLKQGLSASSFAQGGVSTGFSASQGNTTAAPASKGPAVDGPYVTVPYSSAGSPPRLRYQPTLDVPQAARDAEVEGVVEVRIDLDATGRPTSVVVVKGLGYGLDEACAAAWKRSTWRPAESGGQAIGVTGIPQKCTIKALD